jgi:outer membrane protein, multidrug efflux system
VKRGICVALGLLAGCTAGPDYRRPEAPVQGPSLLEADAPGYTRDEPPAQWWRLYEAPDLDALVTKALRHNTDLRMALANLEAAQAGLRAVELQRTVQTGLSASTTYGQASADQLGAAHALSPVPVFDWGAAVSYDLDVSGRIRRAIEAGAADTDEARAALDLARVNVAASVTGAYAAVCAAGNQIAVTGRSIALARTIVSVTARRHAGGIAGINDVVRARTLLAQTEAQLPDEVARQRAGLFLLATLVGDPPEAFPAAVADCATPPVIRRPIPVGDGTALLRRRPDVRQAERRLAASVARIGVATSALYPSVALGGHVGLFATRGSDLGSDRALTWGLGPLVQWTFPNVAAARAGIAQSGALARANLAGFDGTVLTALRETETALSGLARQLDSERSLAEARQQAAVAARNTERLYRGGVGQFIDTLDAERTLIQADAALADATAQVADRQVRLFLALGGGWQDAPVPDATPLDQVAVKRR